MSVVVERCLATSGSKVKRWYVWRSTAKGNRKERLSVYLARLRQKGQHQQAAAVLALAISKGYRV